MAAQGLKDFAGSKSPKFGHFIVEFATPGIGHILKSAGCEYVLFDLEHSGFSFETVKSAMRYFEAADLPAIVRVPSKEYHHIARVLDVGFGRGGPPHRQFHEIWPTGRTRRGAAGCARPLPPGRRHRQARRCQSPQ